MMNRRTARCKRLFGCFLVAMLVTTRGTAEETALQLENRFLRLSFEPRTGTWVGLRDLTSNRELVGDGRSAATVSPPLPPRLDHEAITRVVRDQQALDCGGNWSYTPEPVSAAEGQRILAGDGEGVRWVATDVPSRRGAGDDRLQGRVGEFWYRREIRVPPRWAREELLFIAGAVDDFDTVYLNGQRIGRTGQETPHHWESPRAYRVPAGVLRSDTSNVLLIQVTNGAGEGGISGPVVLGLATALDVLRRQLPELEGHAYRQDASVSQLRLWTREDAFRYHVTYLLPKDAPWLSRRIEVTNASSDEQLLQTTAYASPPLTLGESTSVAFPGTLPVGDVPLESCAAGDVLRPRSEDPLAVLWNGPARLGLGTWFHGEEEFAPVAVRRLASAVEIVHTQHVVVRVQPGETIGLGTQYFWLAHGNRDAALRGVQEVYRVIGLQAPADGLPGLRSMVVYCGHPGGPPELHYRTYGGFRALRDYLPTLQHMQVDLLWLLPIWEHGDGRRWNLYAPFDHFQVSPLYGTEDELRGLSEDGRQRGLRLLFDLVPHGPPDFTPLAREHPEWIVRDPLGAPVYNWGQFAFDNGHPGWQDYMGRAAEWGARQFGAVGARVDCGAGGPQNWNRDVTLRPSRTTLAAGLGMNRAIRTGYRRVHPQVVVLPEEYTGANIFYRIADLTYDAQLYFLLVDLAERQAPAEHWATQLQRFLHDQQQTLPPGGLKMRWVSNHDTVSWTFQKQRPAQAFGLERLRALWALCAFIEGVPMLYQGDEDPAVYRGEGASSVEFLARIYGLRKKLAPLREGTADYQTPQATAGVLAFFRQVPDQSALVLISFNPAATHSTVTGLPPGGTWRDVWSGESFAGGGEVQMPFQPFQIRVLAR